MPASATHVSVTYISVYSRKLRKYNTFGFLFVFFYSSLVLTITKRQKSLVIYFYFYRFMISGTLESQFSWCIFNYRYNLICKLMLRASFPAHNCSLYLSIELIRNSHSIVLFILALMYIDLINLVKFSIN